jgi:hypothetical protein
MSNPTPRRADDVICSECKKPMSRHSGEEIKICTRKIMEKKFGKQAGGIL